MQYLTYILVFIKKLYLYTLIKKHTIMTTIIIEGEDVQANSLTDYVRTLPFAKVIETKKKSFEEAVAECDGRPASEFFDELRRQIKEHFKNA